MDLTGLGFTETWPYCRPVRAVNQNNAAGYSAVGFRIKASAVTSSWVGGAHMNFSMPSPFGFLLCVETGI
jgi:hypothetical protein